VISLGDLRAALVGNWVAFDKHGNPVDYKVPGDIGPAALSVSPVTDALKVVDEEGNLAGSGDRGAYWSVDAIVLNSVVLDRLTDREYSAEDLIQEVRRVGFVWQISPTSAPSAPST
jgi:hypothetical protein